MTAMKKKDSQDIIVFFLLIDFKIRNFRNFVTMYFVIFYFCAFATAIALIV